MEKEYKQWEQEKAVIPTMIRIYCNGNHHTKKPHICESCTELQEYAMMRLEKCPFKKDKQFCSACKVHCYKPEYRQRIKEVMRYAGPRMLFVNPAFAISHVIQMKKGKK